MGTVAGMLAAWLVDRRYVRFETDAAPWMQAVKLVFRIGIVVALRLALKTPLLALTGGHHAADSLRYFIIALTGAPFGP
jgi:hypothetical protein